MNYQERFSHIRAGSPESRDRIRGIKQIWIKDLGIVDRCMTCHIAVDVEGFANKPDPFRSHPGNYIKIHPPKRFGCVTCHDGQGEALNPDDAHEGVYSKKPILRGKFAEALCRRCHPMPQGIPIETELRDAPTLSKGWRLFNEYNCIACHKLKGYKRKEHIAPALTKIGSKVKMEWLFRWLKNPKDYIKDTKMPRYRFSDQDITDIVSYLLELKDSRFEVQLNFNPNDSGLRAYGGLLFESLGCIGCHKIGDKGVSFGPELSDIGKKIKAEWVYQFLRNPKSYDPKTIVPDFKLSDNEIPPLTAYLISLEKRESKRKEVVNTSLSGNSERGKKLVRDYGCIGCHEIEKSEFQYIYPPLDGIGDKRVEEITFGNLKNVERRLDVWLRIKIKEPGRFTTDNMVMIMPDFGFNDDEVEAIVTFLLGERKTDVNEGYVKELFNPDDISLRGRKVIEEYNCLGCHKVKDTGGEIGPDITNEGKKSRPEWLYIFLKRPWKIRPEPVLRVRMPDFSLSDSAVHTVIEYFSCLSNVGYPYMLEEKRKVHPEDIMEGEKLYHEIFSCIACHRINGNGGEIGPDHTDLASRLQREWIEKWVKDPTSIKKDVRMPAFKFEDWQIEAIVDYLMTLGSHRFVEE
ncbi:MAG: hypothetical protein Fur0020_09860 [Thermodesulfovibrionia bacterium]